MKLDQINILKNISQEMKLNRLISYRDKFNKKILQKNKKEKKLNFTWTKRDLLKLI